MSNFENTVEEIMLSVRPSLFPPHITIWQEDLAFLAVFWEIKPPLVTEVPGEIDNERTLRREDDALLSLVSSAKEHPELVGPTLAFFEAAQEEGYIVLPVIDS